MVSSPIDVRHLGRDRVIVAYERDGVIIDPGPASSVDALLEGCPEPRALLLTHVHFDHAGASGVLARRFPHLKVYVHERGAPHVIDTSRLTKSAEQLYGDDMDRLWGEIAPVPEENVVALSGGETVEGLQVEYTPGHASHHVAYFDPDSGEAYTGDVGGVRIPPSATVLPPTPPPDIDLDKWSASIDVLERWRPSALCVTHGGRFDDVDRHLAELRERLAEHARVARDGGREAFLSMLAGAREGDGNSELAARYEQAMAPEHQWLGLERYWAKQEATA